ncbi:MAG: hypothetical protein A2W98_02480 [Bacteroidetes bacterium GWF2_33_38]|nr:MAG: hypothetical protein A2W98_02480 [Bacteroidetes bacterium GWF2_33_38]OFY92402.1 MAG: hypothetical protein A2236_01980 [Bacteroidetes bacterium RIFOXYA2_FULL_33_7]
MKIAIISDIHEDITRLEMAFRLIDKKKCDEIICLGDIVGFSDIYYNYSSTKNASECIRLIRENCKIVLAGNHDLYAIQKTPIYRANFQYPSNWYQLNAIERKNIANGSLWDYSYDVQPYLTESDMSFLDSLQEVEIAEFDDEKIVFSHFAYPDLSGSTTNFPKSISDLSEHFSLMNEINCNFSFSGHGHYGGLMLINNKMRCEGFGIKKIKTEPIWASIPCIAEGKHKNGFVIFHVNEKTIETIKL